MSELHHECGVAAVYHLPGEVSELLPSDDPMQSASVSYTHLTLPTICSV